MQIGKPMHKYYALKSLDHNTYKKYALGYAKAKNFGVKGIYFFLTGTGLLSVVKDMAKGQVVQFGKRRIATTVVTASAYVCAPAIAVLTNATRVVRMCQVVYTTVGYAFELIEDSSHVTFVPIDMVIFGQLIPPYKEGRYTDAWSDMTDVIDNLPGIGDD